MHERDLDVQEFVGNIRAQVAWARTQILYCPARGSRGDAEARVADGHDVGLDRRVRRVRGHAGRHEAFVKVLSTGAGGVSGSASQMGKGKKSEG